MAVNIVAKAVSALLVLQLCLVATKAGESIVGFATQEWVITNGTEDYVLQNQRQYNANIISYDQQLDAFRAVYLGKLSTIDIESALMAKKLDETNNKLNPLELLSPLYKHCVQQYRPKLFAKAPVKTVLDACVSTGSLALSSVLSNPTSVRASLRSYYDYTVPNGILNCKKNYAVTNAQYVPCHINVIEAANIYTINNQKQFAQYLEQSQCAGDARIQTALECSSDQLYLATGSIRETMLLIDMCVANQGATCVGTNKDFIATNACPNALTLSLTAADFRSGNIKNPFYGMSSASGCVQVNFA